MQGLRPVGRGAAARKYDLLTALGAHACQGDKHLQRLALRFITLIVARYNWQTDELFVGQREIARLWSVDERTVTRELARLRSMGWLVTKRAAARGRVAVHGLDLAAIRTATATAWDAVGPDFTARMSTPEGVAAPEGQGGNVVPFPSQPESLPEGAGLWARARARLQAEAPALFDAWLRPLIETGRAGGRLELAAPSRFHASYVSTQLMGQLERAVRLEDATIRTISVIVA
jgi:DNA-binding MarR family transcriptional regulator